MRLADQSPGRLGHRFPVHFPRGSVLVELDRLDEARTTIETGMRISEELGLLLEVDGELADALETLSDYWDRCARSGLAREYPVIGPDLVRLALAAGDPGRARDVAAAVTGVASQTRCPGSPVPRCAAGDWPKMTPTCCSRLAAGLARHGV